MGKKTRRRAFQAEGSTCEKFSGVNGRKQSTCMATWWLSLRRETSRENVRMETNNAFSTTWKTLYTLITVWFICLIFQGRWEGIKNSKHRRTSLKDQRLKLRKVTSNLGFWGFPGGSVVKNSPANAEAVSLILGWDDPLEKEMATQFSILCQGNPMGRGAWRTTVHRVSKSRTQLGTHSTAK